MWKNHPPARLAVWPAAGADGALPAPGSTAGATGCPAMGRVTPPVSTSPGPRASWWVAVDTAGWWWVVAVCPEFLLRAHTSVPTASRRTSSAAIHGIAHGRMLLGAWASILALIVTLLRRPNYVMATLEEGPPRPRAGE